MKFLIGAAASALALTALASAPAQALSESYSDVYHSHYAYATTGCTYTATSKPTSAQTSVDLPVLGGSKTVSTTETGVIKGSNGAAVANVTTTLSSRVSFTTAGGGFKSFSATETASASFSTAATSKACGGSTTATRLATASPRAKYELQLPTATAGWLDVTATAPESASVHGTYGYTLELTPPGAADYSNDKFADADVMPGGSTSSHIYVPRGWTVMAYATASMNATLEYPDRPTQRGGSGSVTVNGTFTPAGSAASGLIGSASARKAVSLPSSLACNGTARLGVAKTGKKTKSVALTVNGRVVKRLKKVTRATAVTVRVPASGHVTLGATVTSKKGATASVTRSYVACR